MSFRSAPRARGGGPTQVLSIDTAKEVRRQSPGHAPRLYIQSVTSFVTWTPLAVGRVRDGLLL